MCQSHSSWAMMQQGAHSLDLASTNASTSAAFLGSRTVNINVGGNQVAVTGNSALTAAQRLAAIQVVRTGQQNILLNAEGAAVGGSATIGSRMASHIAEMVIPHGVSITTISNTGTMNLTGNLNNNGSLLLGTLNPAITSFTLNANNINVGVGGSISTIFPAGSSMNGTSNLGLNLVARNNIVNAGSIATNGSLNITAGGTIVNAIPHPSNGSTALMQAAGNLNLLSGAGAIVNAGLISSLNGSITMAAQAAHTNLNVLGHNGTFSAKNGSIDLRDSAYTGSALTVLHGGNYFSNSLNLFGGNGEVDVNVGQVTGMLTTTAQIAHVKADTELLILGKQCLTGDPTYANTGDIEIAGPITISGGAPLAIIAGGNIISTAADAQIINHGGSVLLIAGANITGGATGGAGLSGTDPAGFTAGDITVSLSGGAGGNIDFVALTPGCKNCVPSTQNVVIDTSNDAGPGGDITLVALANGTKGGNVWLSTGNTTGDIYSWSSATQPIITEAFLEHGGSVNIFAGASSGTSIRLADVYTSGNGALGIGTAANRGPGTGALIIHTSQATTSDGKDLTINALGSITSGNSIIPGALENANIVAGVLNTAGAGGSGYSPQAGGNGGYLQVSAGGSVSSDSILSFGGGGTTSGNGGRGGDIQVVAGTLNVRGDINSSGGGAGSTLTSSGFAQPGFGGSAGNIDIQVSNEISVFAGRQGTGLILASSGGDATENSGGGSFGGGGAGGDGRGLGAGYGGSGTTGGGTAGSPALLASGGPGGGGGFNGSGGGGGGAIAIRGNLAVSGSGGAGGGGGVSSDGRPPTPIEPGSPDTPTFYSAAGLPGGGGGIVGGARGAGPINPPGVGGKLILGGGYGGQGVSSDTVGNGAGSNNGGAEVSDYYLRPEIDPMSGKTIFVREPIWGAPKGGSSGSGNQAFGLGGGPSIGPFPANRVSAGSSTSPGVIAGNITINAKSTSVYGTVHPGNELFGGGSVLALGTGGSVTISGNLAAAGSVRAATLSIPPITPISTASTAKGASGTEPTQVRVLESAPLIKNTGSADSNLTNSLLGTRLATDYTPHEPMRLKLPLQGGVSFEQPDVPGQSMFSASEFTPEVLSALSASGIKFGANSNGNFLDLIKGYVFFLPAKEIKVQTREGLVTIPAGAACWIMETGADVAIFDFHDSGSTGPVKVEAGNKPFTLSPGMQLLLTRSSEGSFNKLNPAHGAIGTRRLRHASLGDGTRAYVCDFSIPHGINNVEVIRNLVRSKDPQHQKSVNRMLKNALILADLTGYNYKTSTD
ncbi:MAG: hypothetical protein K2X77_27375 [Candidatus Obscuribacterales bacterium]|nr:hypothetical protein [Candidatus Obscuribacterales bacterium]